MAKKRDIIETGMKGKLTDRNHKLDDMFEVKSEDFEFKNKETDEIHIEKRPVVFCKNKEQFVDFVKKWRNVNNPLLKVMIDGGGNFLKVSLSVIDVAIRFEEETRVDMEQLMLEVNGKRKRSTYEEV